MTSGDRGPRDPAVGVGSLHVGAGGTGVRIDVAGPPRPAPSTLLSFAGEPFVGRRKDREQIEAFFSETGTHRVLVLHGRSGVGKTRIAVEHALKHRARYPGGTFFLRCDPVPIDDIASMAKLLGVAQYQGERIDEYCRRALAGLGDPPVLLLYDNVTGVDALREWLPPGGVSCHVLATSPLRIGPRAGTSRRFHRCRTATPARLWPS